MKRENIKEAISKKGIRIVGEYMPGAYSVSLNVWVKAGSCFERDGERGISHFIEHMVFKGTQRRTAMQLAEEIDAVGGSINAFTGKQATCFYTRTLSEDMELALDILLDMVCSPLLSETDIENEKGVVCEEIYMSEDDPEDVAHEILCQTAYKNSPIGYPILGTLESARAFTRDDIVAYMSRRYTPENIVISASGAFDFDELVRFVDEKFTAADRLCEDEIYTPNIFVSGKNIELITKDIEQAHICLAFQSEKSCGELSPAVNIMNTVFGSASSSWLFQHIREQQGLVYSIYSMNSPYSDTGYWTLYAGTSEANAKEVLLRMIDELKNLKQNGITDDEFYKAKEQLRRGYILGLETVSVHASSIGKDTLALGKARDDDEILGKLEKTTPDDVRRAIDRIINNNVTMVLVSRTADKELEKIILDTDFDF